MNKSTLTLATMLVTLALGMAKPVMAHESITPHEFAARCFLHGGHLTLQHDLHVGRGVVEMGGCRVDLRTFDLTFDGAHIRFMGDFIAQGGRGSKIDVDESAFIQSERVSGLLHILLFGSKVEVHRSELHFLGNMHFIAHGEEGKVRLGDSFIGSSRADIFISASRDAGTEEGEVVIARSRLFADDNIVVAAGREGDVNIAHNAMVAFHGDMHLTTGADGRIHIHDNNRTMEIAGGVFTGLFARGAFRVASGDDGETLVRQNRILAHVVSIISGGRTVVRDNDFRGSVSIAVRGRRCDAQNNRSGIPVRCAP